MANLFAFLRILGVYLRRRKDSNAIENWSLQICYWQLGKGFSMANDKFSIFNSQSPSRVALAGRHLHNVCVAPVCRYLFLHGLSGLRFARGAYPKTCRCQRRPICRIAPVPVAAFHFSFCISLSAPTLRG